MKTRQRFVQVLAVVVQSTMARRRLTQAVKPGVGCSKLRVVVCAKTRYTGNGRGDFGLEVGGTEPLSHEASEPQR